ncbi:MAG: hypothetical protein AB1432_01305 [Bacteroidota bacterium]|jgi:hypothetical protein
MTKKEIINGIEVYGDLRELEKAYYKHKEKEGRTAEKWYIHQIPKLPEWTNRTYYYKEFKQNPFQLKCNCPDFQERNKTYIGRDSRKLCYHLYLKLTTTKISEHIDELTLLLLEAQFKYRIKLFFKSHFYTSELILGFNDKNDWINIFLKEGDSWKKYSYNQKELRWRYKIEPKNKELLNRRIIEIMVWQLSRDH